MVLGHFPRARALLAAVLVLVACQDDSERLAEHEERAEAYLEEGKHAEAIIEFKSMLEMDPNLADAHYGLAQALLKEKKIRQAYWELQETVRLDPGNLDARLEYGQLLLFGKESDIENALTQAEAVLAAEPERASAWVLKARALQALVEPALREVVQDVSFSDAEGSGALLDVPGVLGAALDRNVRMAYWRKRTPPPARMDPDRDRCGLIWVCPLLPLDGGPVVEAVRMAEETITAAAFEPILGLQCVS